jgi:dipeptidyl-peptidase-4
VAAIATTDHATHRNPQREENPVKGWSLFVLVVILTPLPVLGQVQPATAPAVTREDYARAEGMLPASTYPRVYGSSVDPEWVSDGRFWYRNRIPEGSEFVLVDPAAGTRARAFDHATLAVALSAVSSTTYQPFALPISEIEPLDDAMLRVSAGGQVYACDLDVPRCAGEGPARPRDYSNAVVSPDRTKVVFIRDYDLWMRNFETGEETRLTTDGQEFFGYATNNAGWIRSERPVLAWSPDSRRIATFQHDQRGVGEMYVVSTEVGHPTLDAWRYPLPEDSVIFRIHRVVIDVDAPEVVRLDMPPDQHRSTVCDHVYCNGAFADVEWSDDADLLAFVSSSRDHKRATLRVADPATGDVRDVLEETVETFYESGYEQANWTVLPGSDEVIWYSQRTNWGHLYLYDLEAGELKQPITSGEWNVLQVRHVSEEERRIYFTGSGREPGDPYFEYFYSVGFDGSDLRLLTPDSANHEVSVSPSGDVFVDSWSTPVDAPVTVLRDMNGDEVVALEEADISELVATGWQPPIPFSVKARDGVTDIYGLMYRPTNFDPSERYPIVNSIYPGPQSGSVGSRSFTPSRGDAQSIAELGFIVVQIDATGTPKRSKSFHAAWYGNMGDNGLPDQIEGMTELAERHPWIDLNRVGIYGHSGGGYAAAGAILRYPDFFDVAVSQAGNHDNRNYEDDWGEKWQGLLESHEDGTTNYDNQANQLLAANLRGKLLLAHGTMDDNVPPSNTLLLVDALIAADKDFDLIVFPNRPHGFGNEPYMTRRRWDYFVRHLLGAEPPESYRIGEAGG